MKEIHPGSVLPAGQLRIVVGEFVLCDVQAERQVSLLSLSLAHCPCSAAELCILPPSFPPSRSPTSHSVYLPQPLLSCPTLSFILSNPLRLILYVPFISWQHSQSDSFLQGSFISLWILNTCWKNSCSWLLSSPSSSLLDMTFASGWPMIFIKGPWGLLASWTEERTHRTMTIWTSSLSSNTEFLAKKTMQ